jgi:hypothetical protein
MINIPSHKRNANQNYIEISFSSVTWLSSKTQITTNVGEVVGGKKEPLYIVDGNVD